MQPLSTTSRPHLAQPKQLVRSSMIMLQQKHPCHIITKQYSENQQSMIHMCPPQRSQQQHLLPNMNIQTESTTTANSAKTAMRTSRMLTRAKNKEKRNHFQKHQWTQIATQNMVELSPKHNPIQTHPQKQLSPEIMVQPTTVRTKDMTKNNMMRMHMAGSMMEGNNMMEHKSMKQVQISPELKRMKTIQQTLSMNQQQPTSMTHQRHQPDYFHPNKQPLVRTVPHQQLSRSQQLSHQQSSQHPYQVAEQVLWRQVEPPQMAELNHARVEGIWCQPVQADRLAEESHPRQPLKNNPLDFLDPLMLIYEPIDLTAETTITSPTLLRSPESPHTYTVESPFFDSLSEMSVSPPRTAIRRYSTDDANEESNTNSADEATGMPDITT